MKFKRLIIGSFLVVFLFLICNNYASSEEYNTTVNELFFDHPGNNIFVSGKVENIDHDGFEISVNKKGNYAGYKIITSYEADLDDIAFILGTLNSPTEVTALKIMTVKKDSTNFVIFISLLGLILFLLVFRRYWKFNSQKMLFKRRK